MRNTKITSKFVGAGLAAAVATGFAATAVSATEASAATVTNATASTSAPTDLPTTAEATAALKKASGASGNSLSVAYVSADPAADQVARYDGATVTDDDTVVFWKWDTKAGKWTEQAERDLVSTVDGDTATVTGQTLRGGTSATFLVHGEFTGNDTGNAIVFVDDSESGWGVAQEVHEGTVLRSSGDGVSEVGAQPGVSYRAAFTSDGRLQVKQLAVEDKDASLAELREHPWVQTWGSDDGGTLLWLDSLTGGPPA